MNAGISSLILPMTMPMVILGSEAISLVASVGRTLCWRRDTGEIEK